MTDYWFPTAFSAWGAEEEEAIHRVLKSGRLTYGPEVEACESEFAEAHKRKHGIMVNSGSSANLVSVAALFHKQDKPLQRGDRALVPALAWSTTYAPLVQDGLDLTLIDCDATWNAVNDKDLGRNVFEAKLIVGCSILGNPGYLAKWEKLAKGLGIYYLNDNCESIGAWCGPYGERRFTSEFGDLTTLSFFYSHQISAIEGGMILTDDDELAYLCRLLRNHGNAGFLKADKSFEEEYDFTVFGYNVRPQEINAAVAREQLKKLDEHRRHREQNWRNFETWCIGLPIEIQKRTPVPSPFGFAFTVKNKDTRERLVHAFRSQGIDCRLPTGGSFRKHKYGERWANSITPEADRIHDTGLFLGLAPFPMLDKIEKATDIMKATLLI